MKKHIPEATRLLIVALLFGIRLSGAAQQPTTDSIATPDNELEGVSVIGYRKINTGNIHKQIFELEAKGVPKGASADRALRYVPGLLMGSAGYSILGSEQVAQVLIDGAPASPEELASLPAQSIWRIEVLRGGVDGDRINIRRLRSLTREFKGRIDLGLSQPAPLLGECQPYPTDPDDRADLRPLGAMESAGDLLTARPQECGSGTRLASSDDD